MQVPDSLTKLCEVCSQVDVQLLTHQLHPCRSPLPCLYPPYERRDGTYLVLGSRDEIKSRRSTCDLCGLIAETLDKEPSDLVGTCRITENEEFCTFTLSSNIKARDPGVTHFHITQASVLFDTTVADELFGPPLPWDVKEWDDRRAHYLLHFQIKGGTHSQAIDSTALLDSTHTDSEVLETIGGRYVGTQLNPQLVQRWLHECECKHGDVCIPTSRLQVEDDRQPAFVVDVIQSCLVEPPPRCRYVALSYVWGTAAVFKHLLENTQDLRKPGSLRLLPIPATIRDAITLVRLIGECYLWVDSLCIVQNDLRMQQEEIMHMGTIYSRALFTILAAAGDHADSGLPGVEQGSREQAQKILQLANCELLTVINTLNPQSKIDNTTWAQRAWTFQERVLSNRLLVFSERQVYWNCRSAAYSEERALEETRDIDWHRLPFALQYLTDYLSWEPLQSAEYCDLYHDLVYNYRQRRLTYQTDILNAFNGVSEMLGARQSDTFFWGLPESRFSHTMIWELLGHIKRNNIEVPVFQSDGSKEMIPIPSWSWAAWSGEEVIHINEFLDIERLPVRPMVQFHIVDKNHQLVKIEDRSRDGNPDRHIRAAWEDPELHEVPCLHSTSRIGHLHFWTSLANVRTHRREWIGGSRGLDFFLDPDPDLSLNPNTHVTGYVEDVRQQDFIVVAGRGTRKLILLAIEWRDGVAYRVGKTEVTEAFWLGIKNRQWRLITLG